MSHRASRRTVAVLYAAALGACAAAGAAAQDNYPMRPIRMVVGFAAGGPTDVIARTMAQYMSERLGQPVIIENRTGAGGNIAAEGVIKAPADGYTLLAIVTAYVINPALYPNLPFNFMRDIAAVGGLGKISYVIGVHPGLPIRNIAEMVSYAKANPGKLTYASGGIGSSSHLSTEILASQAGIAMVHVPYKGNTAAYADLIGGRIALMLADRQSVAQHVQSGAIRAIAVTSTARMEAMPNAPTVAETIPGYEASAFYGVGAPRGTPQPIIDRLNAVMSAGHRDPGLRAKFVELDTVPITGNAREFGEFMAAEADRWAKAIKAAGVKGE